MESIQSSLYALTDSQIMLLWEEAFTLHWKNSPQSNILTYRMLIPGGDAVALGKAFEKVLETNDSLRIRLRRLSRWSREAKGDYPAIRIFPYRLWLKGLRQEVAPHETLSLPIRDLPDRDSFEVYFSVFRKGPMKLLGGPLYAAELIRIGDGTIALIIRFHHLVIDGYSFKLLFERLAEAYGSIVNGHEPALPSRSILPVFKESERYLSSPRHEADKAYWKNAFRSQPGFSFPAGKTSLKSGSLTVEETVRNPLYLEAAKLAKSLGPGCSTYALLAFTAAFTVYRITGKTNFALYHMSHGRQNAAAKETIGAMINMFPLFFNFRPEGSIRSELEKARTAYLEALFHGRLSFNDLLMYTIRQSFRHGFNFNHAWMVLNNEDFAASVARTSFEAKSFGAGNQPHQFFCQLLENPGESLEVSLRVQTDKYTEEQARGFLNLFLDTLRIVLGNPDQALGNLRQEGMRPRDPAQ